METIHNYDNYNKNVYFKDGINFKKRKFKVGIILSFYRSDSYEMILLPFVHDSFTTIINQNVHLKNYTVYNIFEYSATW